MEKAVLSRDAWIEGGVLTEVKKPGFLIRLVLTAFISGETGIWQTLTSLKCQCGHHGYGFLHLTFWPFLICLLAFQCPYSPLINSLFIAINKCSIKQMNYSSTWEIFQPTCSGCSVKTCWMNVSDELVNVVLKLYLFHAFTLLKGLYSSFMFYVLLGQTQTTLGFKAPSCWSCLNLSLLYLKFTVI